MMRTDQVTAVEQLGYTAREAAFLHIVARNSGYFLARQFNWFLRRKAGALTQSFIDKLRSREHAAVVDYGQNRFVFHLKSRTVYRACEIENSQNRRPKSDHEIRTRLMILDYLLDLGECETLLSTEEEKAAFFIAQGLSGSDLPRVVFQSSTDEGQRTERFFIERFPITVHGAGHSVRLTYFDPGEFTPRPFSRFLLSYSPLLTKLAGFELVYVALSGHNIAAAKRQFLKMFPENDPGDKNGPLPFGPAHLQRFLRAERLWNTNSNEFRHEDLAVLKKGERIYTTPVHARLRHLWIENEAKFQVELEKLMESAAATGVFRAYVLEHAYPIFGYKAGRG